VYLAPEDADFERIPGFDPVERFFLPPDQTLLGIRRGTLAVYDASGLRLREATRRYSLQAPARLRGLIE
jgi:hypothetical protein